MSTHDCAAFRCDPANNVHFRQDGSEIVTDSQRQAADSDLALDFHHRTRRCVAGPGGSHLLCAITEGKHRAGEHGDCLPVEDGGQTDDYVNPADLPSPSWLAMHAAQQQTDRTKAEEQGYSARSTTSPEGRSVQVTMTADFARQVAYSLTERIVAVGEDTTEGRWLKGFVADLVKVNP